MNFSLFRSINDLAGHRFPDDLMTFAAKDLIAVSFLVVLVLSVLSLRRRHVAPVVFVAVALVLTFALGLLAAAVHPELRPFQSHPVHVVVSHGNGQSFPSDHATAAFGIALAVLVWLSRTWGIVLLVLAAVIGFARVYTGIHYPGDIGGSALVACAGVGLVYCASRLTALQPPTMQR